MSANEYAEYKRNLYTDAMGCVSNRTGSNVYADRIPLDAVRARFASEHVETYPTAYVVPGTHPDGLDDVTVLDNTVQTIVRKRDGHVHGRFGADTNRRQYEFLFDLATGVTGESMSDLHVTAAGTTRNGGRGYVQFSTAQILTVAGMDYAPFVTVGMSHDGSLSVTSAAGTSIISCANMIAGILGAKALHGQGAKHKQTKNATDAGIITRHTIGLDLVRQADDFDREISKLAATVVTDEQWTAILDSLAPVNVKDASKNAETRNEHTRETLTGMWNGDPRCAPWHGSALGVVQTLNTFDLWERNTRGETDAATRMTDEFLSGKLAVRENSRAALLGKVLATV